MEGGAGVSNEWSEYVVAVDEQEAESIDIDSVLCAPALTDSAESESSDDLNLHEDLKAWTNECKVPAVAVDKLLKILHKSHPQLPLTCRTLIKSRTSNNAVVFSGGDYIHFGLLSGLMMFRDVILDSANNSITFQVNIDGLPLFKSSAAQLWPILGKLVNSSYPFIIGVFSDSSKPSDITNFLHSFIEEAKLLASDGFTLDGRKLIAQVACFICDTPARAFLKQIKKHSGYFGCERCVQKGYYCEGRVTFPETESVKRLDEDFRAQTYAEHQIHKSPLTVLDIDLVSCFALDSMHLIHLGVMRRLLLYWIKGAKATRLSTRHVAMIADNLLQLKPFISAEFARKTRPLNELD
jgi:hypothetical protein